MTRAPLSADEVPEHRAVSSLLPWYVNETLGRRDRRRVELHLRDCALCRGDLLLEQAVYDSMSANPGVDHLPAASLQRLNARLDQLGTDPMPASTAGPTAEGMRWHGVIAASIATVAIVVGVLFSDHRSQRRLPAGTLYQTVTVADDRSPDEVIRAVFSPTITLVELQSILDEAQLRIISGPTEAGVYALAAKSTRPVRASLSLLRQHAAVRFAESTRADPVTGAAP